MLLTLKSDTRSMSWLTVDRESTNVRLIHMFLSTFCQLLTDCWRSIDQGSTEYRLDVDRVLIKMLFECRSRCRWSVNWGFNKGIDWGYQSNGGCLKCTWSNFNIKVFHGVLGSCNVTRGSKYQCSLVLLWTFLTNYTVAIRSILNICFEYLYLQTWKVLVGSSLHIAKWLKVTSDWAYIVIRPSNPHHMQIWRFWKTSPEKPGD